MKRIILLALGITGMLLFAGPLTYIKTLNIGNETGIFLSVILIIYAIFFNSINHLIAAMWQKKIGRLLLIISELAIALIICLTIIESALMIKACNAHHAGDETIIVLGCKVYGTNPSTMLSTRIDAAYDYLIAHPDSPCILSGGKGSDEAISEAECMYNSLINKGIPKDRLYIENASTSTKENIAFSKKIIDENGLSKNVSIVTNEFHEYRASIIVKEAGLNYGAVPASTPWWLFPTYYVRELYGILSKWTGFEP